MSRRDAEEIRDLCNTERKRRGWTAYALARHSGVSRATLCRWLRGGGDITSGNLGAVLRAMGIRLVASTAASPGRTAAAPA